MTNDEMYDNNLRANLHKKDMLLEKALTDLNDLIDPLASDRMKLPQKPIILIMGCARSGSTLLMQYLSSLGVFSYPSNLISRFYKNPYLGILIQKSLFELDPTNQLCFKQIDNNYHSLLGKTTGAMAPNEFWYFWREYFKFSKYNYLNKEDLMTVDSISFLKKLSSFEVLTSMPLVMKGMILNWNIPFLHSIYQKFIFINLKRDVIPNAKSLLQAREDFFCNTHKWYSFKPQQYNELKDKTPIEQVVAQVYYTQKAIQEGLADIPNNNVINISYEDFCNNPANLLSIIQEKFLELGSEIEMPVQESPIFKARKNEIIDFQKESEFKEALLKYENRINGSKKDNPEIFL